MSEFPTQESPTLEDFTEKQLPSTLNVLTILSIIGSVMQLIGGVTNYFSSCANIDKMEKVSGQDNLPEWLQNLMGSSLDMMEKQCENRLTIMIVAILAAILCLSGVILMRKRIKRGFILYSVGEVLPVFMNFFIIGFGTMVAVVSNMFALGWAGLWVLLYGFQSRHLTD